MLAEKGYSRGKTVAKLVTLKRKQTGNSSDMIAYADSAKNRLRKKLRKIASHSNRNIAATAVAKGLACFIRITEMESTAVKKKQGRNQRFRSVFQSILKELDGINGSVVCDHTMTMFSCDSRD